MLGTQRLAALCDEVRSTTCDGRVEDVADLERALPAIA
jgi:hypothetical protein